MIVFFGDERDREREWEKTNKFAQKERTSSQQRRQQAQYIARNEMKEKNEKKYIYSCTNVIKVGLCKECLFIYSAIGMYESIGSQILSRPSKTFPRATHRFIVQEAVAIKSQTTQYTHLYVETLEREYAHPKIEHDAMGEKS